MKTSEAKELKLGFIACSVVCALALLVGSVAVAHARGGGGGGYTRSGAASTGSFSGGAVTAGRAGNVAGAAAAARAGDNRQDNVDNGHRDHPVAAAAVAARAADNRRDNYYGGGSGAYYAELPCSSSETYIDGVNYYACGTNYYVQSYSGGAVVYVPSSPPPGY
jgi:hypothetical protein